MPRVLTKAERAQIRGPQIPMQHRAGWIGGGWSASSGPSRFSGLLLDLSREVPAYTKSGRRSSFAP
jgi:hypothetical protein